jgi:predicted acylesterase/phospholipase RssA
MSYHEVGLWYCCCTETSAIARRINISTAEAIAMGRLQTPQLDPDPEPEPQASPDGDPPTAAPWWSISPYREAWLAQPFELRAFTVVVYLQVVFAVGIAVLPWTLGAAKRFTFSALLVYLLLVVWVDRRVLRHIRDHNDERDRVFLAGLMHAGVGLLIVIPLLLSWALMLRADTEHPWLAQTMVLAVLLLGVLFWRAGREALRSGFKPWVSFGMALILGPLLVSWAAGSVVWRTWVEFFAADSAYVLRDKLKAPATVPTSEGLQVAAVAPPRCPEVSAPAHGARRVHMALALAGGGYRAAVAHAGLLDALDEECIVFDYLTSVSGGSIIGAYYGLGLGPRQFAADLYRGKPGLANDQLLMTSQLSEWFGSSRNSADTYAAHFERVFFGRATLKELRDRPIVLLNATAVEEEGDFVREVFFKGRAAGLDAKTRVADVVAASGAFPGAFAPMRLRWAKPDEEMETATTPRRRAFIDGGVVDNLGLEGLRRYLTMPRLESPLPPRPDVLVISDTSLYAGRAAFGAKAELVSVLVRAEELSWTALHRHVYARFTGAEDYLGTLGDAPPEMQVANVRYRALLPGHPEREPTRLYTVVVPVTAPATARLLEKFHEACVLNAQETAAEVQKYVASFRTLDELQPWQVVRAYWLGYVLGKVYAPAIECAWTKASDPQHKCPERPERNTLLTCPTEEEVLAGLQKASTRN